MLPSPSTSHAVGRASVVSVARGLNADNPSVGAAITLTPPIVSISPRPRAGAAVRMSRLAIAVLVAAALLGVIRVGAAGVGVGARDFSYTHLNGVQVPTEDKPQSKLPFQDGVRTITAGATSAIDVTMDGVPIYGTATASLGTSRIRTLQIGNDKQLPFSLYADNIEAVLP